MSSRPYPVVPYTFRAATAEDIPALLTFHNTPYNLQFLYERQAADLIEPVSQGTLYLVERDDPQQIFGMGGMFTMAPGHRMIGGLVDQLKNSGKDRTSKQGSPNSLQRLCWESALLTHARRAQQDGGEFGTVYAEVDRDSQFLRFIKPNLEAVGFTSAMPDSDMQAISTGHMPDPSDPVPTIFFTFQQSALPGLALKVLQRGSQVMMESRAYRERQAITLDVPIVHDRKFLTALACHETSLQPAVWKLAEQDLNLQSAINAAFSIERR